MKTIIFALSLIISVAASAQVYVYPNVINMGYSAQVQVHNTSRENINCSGNLSLYTQSGRMESHYFYEFIRVGAFSTRNYYLMSMNERIQFVNHSIFCRRAN